jgi:hypothetical protein
MSLAVDAPHRVVFSLASCTLTGSTGRTLHRWRFARSVVAVAGA